jgi:hypothetical protein
MWRHRENLFRERTMKAYELARRDLLAAGGLGIGIGLAARPTPANAQGGAMAVYSATAVTSATGNLQRLAPREVEAGDVAIADGYYTSGDQGGGTFYYEGSPHLRRRKLLRRSLLRQ